MTLATIRKFYENGENTTKIEYLFNGFGLDSTSKYKKKVTVFSIAHGLIKEDTDLDHEYYLQLPHGVLKNKAYKIIK